MTLKLWNELHKDMSMPTEKEKADAEAKAKENKTVLVTCNIGTNDLRTFAIEEAYQDGDLVTLRGDVADRMIRAGVAVEYTDEVKKAREDEQKRVHDAQVAAATLIAQRELAVEAAKEEAKKGLKGETTKQPKVATHKGEGPLPTPGEEGAPILKARAGGSAPPINEPGKEPKKNP